MVWSEIKQCERKNIFVFIFYKPYKMVFLCFMPDSWVALKLKNERTKNVTFSWIHIEQMENDWLCFIIIMIHTYACVSCKHFHWMIVIEP